MQTRTAEPVKVAVLGAGGTIAPAIVRDLAESEEVESMLLLDLDAGRAAAVAREQGGGKATGMEADARAGLAAFLEGVDVLVNSASYRINLDAMKACLEAGCHYLDLGGLYHVTDRQLQLNGDFERAGLLALLGIGSSPGKTNLMAARAVAELDRADAIEIAAAGRDLEPPPGFSIPYALPTLVDELTMSPVVLRGGAPVEIEPMSDGGLVDFGDPIGTASTIYTLHSELRTFGESFSCDQASFRLSLAAELLERLRDLVDASEERVATEASEAKRPSPQTVAVHLIRARGAGREARIRSVTGPHHRWGLGGGIVSTATPAAAAVRLLARGAISARGALPPERCLDPAAFFTELEARGVRFELETEVDRGDDRARRAEAAR